MVNGPNVAYQPAVAYQGGTVNTPYQEPKTDSTQPKQAAAPSTQHGGGKDASKNSGNGGDQQGRGQLLNVTA
ncbi:MAG: hypothetical protein KGL10_04790 [Alphaproteobacteria bacterium]|nr:hypothetical protein [Alphaproteobacteria bacterium]MDE2336607.1 hypothetical protein [Alphaproteobacteria bacterium]